MQNNTETNLGDFNPIKIIKMNTTIISLCTFLLILFSTDISAHNCILNSFADEPELGFNDIPHHYYKNYGQYYELSLSKDGRYHLSQNGSLSLIPLKGVRTFIQKCTSGKYTIKNGYLELQDSEYGEIILGSTLLSPSLNIPKFYKILKFEGLTLLIPSVDKFTGEFNPDVWNLELINILNNGDEKRISTFTFSSILEPFPVKKQLLPTEELSNKIEKEYQHYRTDSIHLKVTHLDKNYIATRNKEGKYSYHITFTLNKGSEDRIMKNMNLFPRKSPVLERRYKGLFCWNFRLKKLLVTEIYPNKCKAIMFLTGQGIPYPEECYNLLQDYSTFAEIKQ